MTIVLAVIGMNVGTRLASTNLLVPGSESARESQLFQREFGASVSAPIMLAGPRAALDRQGPQLAAALAKLPGAQVVSAWNGGTLGRNLRPSPRRALVLLAITPRTGVNAAATERSVENVVHDTIAAPVTAQVSGVDSIAAELQSASLRAVHRAELIAIPVLLIVLLIVFGSPTAAMIPVALGLGTVLSSFGLIGLLGETLSLTELATTAASMMGLALGVDYSLLVVARFRDELVDPADPGDVTRAASVAALRAGRTVAFAGGAITILMLLALAVAAGTLLLSAVVGVIIVAAASVVGTVLAVPAALTLFGHRIRRHGAEHELAATAPGASRAARLARSVPVVGVSLTALLVVGWQALSLATGPPDARQLPSGSAAARDYAAVSRGVGAGWVTPFELLIVAHSGAITTLPRLDALASAQHQIARDPDVADIVGPAELAKRAAPLAHAESSVAASNRNLKRSAQVIGGLNSDLGQAASGAHGVQSGFAQATAAVQKLASGGSSASAVGALQAGLQHAASGSQQIDSGLSQAAGAAGRIATGGASIAAGANNLVAALRSEGAAAGAAQPQLTALSRQLKSEASGLSSLSGSVAALGNAPSGVGSANGELGSAASALSGMRLGRLDPKYRAVVADVQAAQSDLSNASSANASASSLASQINQDAASEQAAGAGVDTLAAAAARLSASANQLQQSAGSLPARISELQSGQHALASGIERLAASESAMTQGLGTLSGGTAALSARLAALQNGAAAVASGLSGEQRQAAALSSALNSGSRNASRTTPAHAPILGTLAHNPGFFGSGYLVLAALEGSPAAKKAGIDFIVNVASNGQAARLLIVPRSGVRTASTAALRQRLQRIAATLAAKTNSTVLIGGPAAQLRDYAAAAARKVPLLIGVLMLATFLLLMVVFRSLFAPLIGVLLNLLSVGASFGVLSLLTRGPHPIIGGPGYVDALSVSAMFAVVFALSLDYQVFLLMRMREGWLRTGSTTEGVDYGVARTARVIAGAAAIMAGVFLAFATADVATIRQLGVGLAVAILIDATIVRLILLPCALRLGGRLTWWLPGWLDRALPVVDIGAERRHPSRPVGDDRPDPAGRALAEAPGAANLQQV
ncbi:MAG TPA: MMPL family transporter [Solirubrobacteraceae bacterium]|nr:MMPL family transporter [Solirubrobacteraceae bacterium]